MLEPLESPPIGHAWLDKGEAAIPRFAAPTAGRRRVIDGTYSDRVEAFRVLTVGIY
jgi:hypothetical protein